MKETWNEQVTQVDGKCPVLLKPVKSFRCFHKNYDLLSWHSYYDSSTLQQCTWLSEKTVTVSTSHNPPGNTAISPAVVRVAIRCQKWNVPTFHPVHLMDVQQRHSDPQTKPINFVCESVYGLLQSAPTISIYIITQKKRYCLIEVRVCRENFIMAFTINTRSLILVLYTPQ